jgi:hypothetical protein
VFYIDPNVGAKEQMRRRETVEMRFVRAVVGCRMTDHKRNENTREELGITGINTVTKSTYQNKWQNV